MPASACSCLQLRDQGGRPGEMSSEVEGGPGLGGPYGKGPQAPKGPTNCVCKNRKLAKKTAQCQSKGSIFKIPAPTRSLPRDQISGGRAPRFPRFLQPWRAAHRRTGSTGLPACRCRSCATSVTTSTAGCCWWRPGPETAGTCPACAVGSPSQLLDPATRRRRPWPGQRCQVCLPDWDASGEDPPALGRHLGGSSNLQLHGRDARPDGVICVRKFDKWTYKNDNINRMAMW